MELTGITWYNMEKRSLFVCLCVVLIAIQVPTTKGDYCTQKAVNYYAQSYCTNYSWWGWWCWSHAYRRDSSYYIKRNCCPGYTGQDCSTPICITPCGSGSKCVAPNQCSVPPKRPQL